MCLCHTKSVEKIIHEDTYRQDFKQVVDGKHIPHDMRFTYAKNTLGAKIANGIKYKVALKEISTELNHVSAERIKYYLVRA